MRLFIALISLFFFSCVPFTQASKACGVQQSLEDKKSFVKNLEFVGIVKIMERESYSYGNVKSVTVKPFMIYRVSKEFNIQEPIKIEFENIRTSCDYSPRQRGAMQEAIIKKNEKGGYLWGNISDMALGSYWDKLRGDAEYVGKVR